jgi:hypothetical protein
VNSQQAKEILMLYRPGGADAHDPQLAEALSLARRDEELGRWFEKHCALQAAIRDKFCQITVPTGLKEQILAEHTPQRKIIWWRQPAVLAAAAAIVLLIGLAAFWSQPREKNGFSGFRSRMVSTARRIYSMDLETNDLKQIRAFLAKNGALSNYVLPPALEKTPGAGCKRLTWHGKRVSMVCFNSGRPLESGEKSDLFLFVIDRSSLRDAPPANPPKLVKVNKLMTASWSAGDNIYVLAAPGDEDFIRKYL